MSEMYWMTTAWWERDTVLLCTGPCKWAIKCTLSLCMKFRPLKIDSFWCPPFKLVLQHQNTSPSFVHFTHVTMECFLNFFSTILGLSKFLLYYAGSEDTKLKYVFSWCDKYILSHTAHNFLSNVLKQSTKASSQLFKHIQIGNISICLFLKFAPLACIKEKSPNRGNAELF